MIGTQTAHRAPTHAAPLGITIAEIERQVLALRANWPLEAELRELALLFAVLKEGSSIGKLMQYTGYEKRFISGMTEDLRQHNKLVTGVLSEQFLLKMLPGSEQLIAEITGGKPVTAPKETPVKDEPFDDPDIHAPEADPLPIGRCAKDVRCRKSDGHTGRCKTTDAPARVAKAKVKGSIGAYMSPEAFNKIRMPVVDPPASSMSFRVFCEVDGQKFEATGGDTVRLKKALATVEGMLQ